MLDRLKDLIAFIAALAALATAAVVGGGEVPAWLLVAVGVGLGLVVFERHERLMKTQAALDEANAATSSREPALNTQSQKIVDRIDGLLRTIDHPNSPVPWSTAERINYLVSEVRGESGAYAQFVGAPPRPRQYLTQHDDDYASESWAEAAALLAELRADVAPGYPWPKEISDRLVAYK